MKVLKKICKSFSRQAETYEKNAFVQREIGERMLERLAYMKMKPCFMLDLGCGTGVMSEQLAKLYPDACLTGIDISLPMLQQAKKKNTLSSAADLCSTAPRETDVKQPHLLQADFTQLPFEDAIFDLIFSNQVIHWASDLGALFQEVHRVLKPGGCFLFSTLGPSTFMELKEAWALVDNYSHTHEFIDMHEVGDALLKHAFLDPVMDREDLCVHFSSLKALLTSLKQQGVCNLNPRRNAGLTTPAAFKRFVDAYERCLTASGEAPINYEIIQGHAWKGQTHHGKRGHEVLMRIDKTKDIKDDSGFY